MGKWIAILLGIILLALGVWGIIVWASEYVWPFVAAALVIGAVIIGLGAIAFGYSEIRSAAEERKIAEAAPPPTAPPTAGGETPSDTGQAPPTSSS
jgi:membrane protein involved in colicin uptake